MTAAAKEDAEVGIHTITDNPFGGTGEKRTWEGPDMGIERDTRHD